MKPFRYERAEDMAGLSQPLLESRAVHSWPAAPTSWT
jgi:hypothetical protein